MKLPKPFRPCRVCKSPYRNEMEFLLSQRVSVNQISIRYHKKFECSKENLYDIFTKHVKNEHPPLITLKDDIGDAPVKASSFEEYANKLLDVGMQPGLMNQRKVSHSNVIAAKRALIEEKKVNNEMNAQKLAFMKFFRGTPVEGEIIEDGESNDQDGSKSLPSNTD